MYDESRCPQCGCKEIKIAVETEPLRVEATCTLCGRRHIAPVTIEGKPEVEEVPGNGVFHIVTVHGAFFGAIEAPWSDMHQGYFDSVFAHDALVCGRVSHWDPEECRVVVTHKYGEVERIFDLSAELAGVE